MTEELICGSIASKEKEGNDHPQQSERLKSNFDCEYSSVNRKEFCKTKPISVVITTATTPKRKKTIAFGDRSISICGPMGDPYFDRLNIGDRANDFLIKIVSMQYRLSCICLPLRNTLGLCMTALLSVLVLTIAWYG